MAAGAQANRAVRDNSLAGRFFTAVRNRILLVERKSSVATKHGSLGGSGYVARSSSTFHSTRRQQNGSSLRYIFYLNLERGLFVSGQIPCPTKFRSIEQIS